ncbi:MAG: cysteine--tRNA ligase [Prevotellaceae bacterium]|jgi:cysteinyl-tRNA synthetase|nr:cysteine--tRNA ligase [Prevotellaceae bacterium]
MQPIHLYNTLSRKKEFFEPLHPPMAGMYVCGPTVYGDPHLGHARSAITFDVLYRFLRYMGYQVRYVRNITDVGHLENDADEGEDKVAKKARIERLEPMEVVQYYNNRYHDFMRMLQVLPPSIEPLASGHIIEQIEFIKEILIQGFGYEVNGSVYFDVEKYNQFHQYGKLSGRVLDDLRTNTRDLEGQSDKRNPFDFALWKKATPEHIMCWPSPWSIGFPGWHLECSAMSIKYLGETFDIHGGGMDLLFPHHECEIAQSVAAKGHETVRYWLHNNMITNNGQKMGKSLGNFITLEEMFAGTHKLLAQAYTPMTVRFFILQAHYRSTLDFSNDALQAAEKGLKRLQSAAKAVSGIAVQPSVPVSPELQKYKEEVIDALCDDLNTPIALAHLFDVVRWVNSTVDKKGAIHPDDRALLDMLLIQIPTEVLGLSDSDGHTSDVETLNGLMEMILEARAQAKERKDYAASDAIRDRLAALGISVKDTKEGVTWGRFKK